MSSRFCTQFIPMDVINYPTHGSIIYHPSILPKHRGASAINWWVTPLTTLCQQYSVPLVLVSLVNLMLISPSLSPSPSLSLCHILLSLSLSLYLLLLLLLTIPPSHFPPSLPISFSSVPLSLHLFSFLSPSLLPPPPQDSNGR